MTNHTDVVEHVKADLVARGVPLTGACGAFAITKRVAWQLRLEGAGLLKKPAGNNCDGFADGIIAFQTGIHYDILFDAGGENRPQWSSAGAFDLARWAPPLPVEDAPIEEPDPIVDPPGDSNPLVMVQGQLEELLAKLDALKAQSDANTEKIQAQINQVVENAEASAKAYLPLLDKLGKIF
jgi:hypothetical protein